MTPVEEFDGWLQELEQDLLDLAEAADEAGVSLIARNFEIWSHTVAVFRADLNGDVDHPGSLMDYLRARGDYDLPEGRGGG